MALNVLRPPFSLFLQLMVISACIQQACGSSVRRVSLDEMLALSELVVEGEVLSAESRLEPAGRTIRTAVTLRVLDVIKGHAPGMLITLDFLGGRVGPLQLTVSEMQLPRAGERGIYFVERLGAEQIHPLYGWEQGHFLIQEDAEGVPRVTTARGLPVVALSNERSTAPLLSDGTATGIRTSVESPGIALGEFKTLLRRHRSPR